MEAAGPPVTFPWRSSLRSGRGTHPCPSRTAPGQRPRRRPAGVRRTWGDPAAADAELRSRAGPGQQAEPARSAGVLRGGILDARHRCTSVGHDMLAADGLHGPVPPGSGHGRQIAEIGGTEAVRKGLPPGSQMAADAEIHQVSPGRGSPVGHAEPGVRSRPRKAARCCYSHVSAPRSGQAKGSPSGLIDRLMPGRHRCGQPRKTRKASPTARSFAQRRGADATRVPAAPPGPDPCR